MEQFVIKSCFFDFVQHMLGMGFDIALEMSPLAGDEKQVAVGNRA